MKRSLFAVAVVVGLVMAWTIGRMQGQAERKVVFVDSAKANYTAMFWMTLLLISCSDFISVVASCTISCILCISA